MKVVFDFMISDWCIFTVHNKSFHVSGSNVNASKSLTVFVGSKLFKKPYYFISKISLSKISFFLNIIKLKRQLDQSTDQTTVAKWQQKVISRAKKNTFSPIQHLDMFKKTSTCNFKAFTCI